MNIEDATQFFGNKRKLAAALGVSPSAVTQWCGVIPEGRKYQIQILTGGRLKAASAAAKETTQTQKNPQDV